MRSLGIVAACVVLVAWWVVHELRQRDPLIDVRQVRNRQVLTADVAGFLMAVAMYLFLPIIVEFVQVPTAVGYGFGASVVVSGLVFVPLSVGSFAASRCLTLYDRHVGSRSMLPFGAAIFAGATLFFALCHTQLWEAFAAAGLAGLGIGFTFAAMPGFIVRAVPPDETGSAMGFYQVLRSIGLSVGSALAAAVLTAYTHAGATFPTAGGFHTTLLLACGLCLLTAVLTYILPGTATPTALSHGAERLLEEEAEIGGAGLLLTGGEVSAADGRPVSPGRRAPS
jgi:MFS family permease